MNHSVHDISHALSGTYTFSTSIRSFGTSEIVENDAAKNSSSSSLLKSDLESIQEVIGGDLIKLNTMVYEENYDGKREPEAYVLHIPNGVGKLVAWVDSQEDDAAFCDALFQEMNQVKHDNRFFNARKQRIEYMRAYHFFGVKDESQDQNLDQGIHTHHSFKDLPQLQRIRSAFDKMSDEFDITTKGLYAEGNVYADITCGVRYHGEDEKAESPVIGIHIGEPKRITWRSFLHHRYFGKEISIQLNHGDVYFMSEHAVGAGWQRNSYKEVIFRHRCGSDYFFNRHDKELEKRFKIRDAVDQERTEEREKKKAKRDEARRLAMEARQEKKRKREENHKRIDKIQEILTRASREGPSDHYFYEWLKFSDNPRHNQLARVWLTPNLKRNALKAEQQEDVDEEVISQMPDISDYGEAYWNIMRKDFESRVGSEQNSKKQHVIQDELITGDSISIEI